VHVTADTAKKIATDYYSQPIRFSYWNSCSNGGRQGLLEAQRYPDDFDGIVANAPWVDQTGFTIGAMWNQKALTEGAITPAMLVLVAQKVMDKCDAVDGLKDGLIDDPRACKFDAARDVPACSASSTSADCLTPAQASAINKVYSGPISKGKSFIAGYMPGSEASTRHPMARRTVGGSARSWHRSPGSKPADFNLAKA
jgi:feruloyl esterase